MADVKQTTSSPSVHQAAHTGYANPDLYEKAMPTYPEESIDHIISLVPFPSSDNCTIIDLGAGTGKLTKSLQSCFENLPLSRLIAVEPLESMREIFQKCVPGIEIVNGAADSIPFPDESLDAIFIGQAFHWFANESSLVEFYRVLKPGAPVIMIWNKASNENALLVKQMREEYEKYGQNCPQYWQGIWRDIWNEDFARNNFTPLESRSWNWEMSVTKQYIWERFASTSYIASLDHEELNQVRERFEKILVTIPEEKITACPQSTDAFWAFKK